MRAVLGQSTDPDTREAIQEVMAQLLEGLAGETPVAALVFSSVDLEHEWVLAAIQGAWPGLPTIGSTGDGELSSASGVTHDSLLVTLVTGSGIHAWSAVGTNLSADPSAAVQSVLASLEGRPAPALAFSLFAPSADACQVLRELNTTLKPIGCPVFGGLSGDHGDFSKMVEFCDSNAAVDSLPVLFLAGDVQVSWGTGSGWFPIGDAYRVTAAAGNIIGSIEGRPPFELYQEYYGDLGEMSLGEYPLAVYDEGLDDPWYLRAIMGRDATTGSIRCSGAVPEGALVRMTQVLPEGLLGGSTESAHSAGAGLRGVPDLALVFSCSARKWVMGTSADLELDTLRAALPEAHREVPLAGLYVFGEIAPATAADSSILYNETVVTVLLGSNGD